MPDMAGRKPKRPEDKMSESIRVPMTRSQKERLETFREVTGRDLATWARELMLETLDEWEDNNTD